MKCFRGCTVANTVQPFLLKFVETGLGGVGLSENMKKTR